jgi:hypothetical protein
LSLAGARLLFKEQFASAAGRFDDGLNEGNAKFPFFEFEDTVNCATGGRRDSVFQERGMIAGL